MKQLERRAWRLSDVEVRASEDGKGLTFKGYAAVFNEWTKLGSLWKERVAPGAFKKTLAEGADVRFVLNHDANFLLARRGSGTLRLTEDEKGLVVEADMADVSYARDISTLIQRGDMDQMSFAFYTVKDEEEFDEDGMYWRTLKEVRLHDVSVVTWAAYPTTTASVRGADVDSIGERIGSEVASRALHALAGTVDPGVYVAALRELREGKELSQVNREAIASVMDSIQTLLRSAEPEPEVGADEATTSDATTRKRSVVTKRLGHLETISDMKENEAA